MPSGVTSGDAWRERRQPVWCGRRIGEALEPGRTTVLAGRSDHGLDVGDGTGLDVGGTEVAAVGQQGFGFASPLTILFYNSVRRVLDRTMLG